MLAGKTPEFDLTQTPALADRRKGGRSFVTALAKRCRKWWYFKVGLGPPTYATPLESPRVCA